MNDLVNILGNVWGFLRRSFYLSIEGGAQSGSIDVDEKGVRLPHQPCRFVKLENLTVSGDAVFSYKSRAGNGARNASLEVYYGFGDEIAHALYDGRATELYPIDNLNRVILRARPGETVKIYYSWFY